LDDKIANLFSGVETEKRKGIIELMQDWKDTVSEKKRFYLDGFFPRYYKTNPKVLFIAREQRDGNEPDNIINAIKTFESENINNIRFWKRILCMFNIIRNNGNIDETVTADQIAKEMAKNNDYGFAFMNISKYINEAEDSGTKHNRVLMNKFLEDSKLDERNFFQEELEILEPDIIITANLWNGSIKKEYLEKCFSELIYIRYDDDKKKAAALHSMKIKNKKVKLIDFYHFSSRFNDMDYFYKPLSELLHDIL
jgi:hypothetical protein